MTLQQAEALAAELAADIGEQATPALEQQLAYLMEFSAFQDVPLVGQALQTAATELSGEILQFFANWGVSLPPSLAPSLRGVLISSNFQSVT